MTKTVNFKYSCDVEATDRITGFKGTIVMRQEQINGSIQYALQPRSEKKESSYVPDAKVVDEGYIQGPAEVAEKVDFRFDCGDKVKNFINGFEGVVVARLQWLNGCIQYLVEAPMIKTEIQGFVLNEKKFWEQELELVKDKAVPTNKKRTGGPTTRLCTMGKI